MASDPVIIPVHKDNVSNFECLVQEGKFSLILETLDDECWLGDITSEQLKEIGTKLIQIAEGAL